MRTRKATLVDVPELVKLEECFSPELRADDLIFIDNINSKSVDVIVATLDSRVVGCIILFYRSNSPKAYIDSLVVCPKYRKKGVASLLKRVAELNALKRKKTIIQSDVETTNVNMVKLNHSLGYQIIKKKPNYYGKGRAAFRMSKEIV